MRNALPSASAIGSISTRQKRQVKSLAMAVPSDSHKCHDESAASWKQTPEF
jgi:hypothetical protein